MAGYGSLGAALLAAQAAWADTAPAPQAPAVSPVAATVVQNPAPAQSTLAQSTHYLLEHLSLKSKSVLVIDEDTHETLAAKNADVVAPLASVTKLMTAMVVIDAHLPPDEVLEITEDDTDRYKHTPSRLKVGTKLRRDQMLLLALMASENRAALALGRNYPGYRAAFVDAMNAKAKALGMTHTHFVDPAGLSSQNVSSARDLHILLDAASQQPLIRDYTTRPQYTVRIGKRDVRFISSNRLVRRSGAWDIELQKTGFTNEAGRCLVMRANVAGHRLAMIFLNSFGKLTRYGDASRVRQRLEVLDRKRPKEAAVFEATSASLPGSK